MEAEGIKLGSFDNFWRERLMEYPQSEEFQRLFDELKGELKTPERKLPRPVVVSLIGIPGSGKSTFSILLQEFIPALHLRSDVIGLIRLPKGPDYDYYKAYVIQEALANYYLAREYSVILDNNNRTLYNREQTYRLAKKYGAYNLLFRLSFPFELAVTRTQSRDVGERRGTIMPPREQVVNNLLMFQAQIEEPEPEELKKFDVFYREVDTSKSLDEIREILYQDQELQKIVA